MYAISIRSPLYVTKNHSDLCQILENNYIPVKQIPSQAYFLNIIRAEVRYYQKYYYIQGYYLNVFQKHILPDMFSQIFSYI